MTITIIGAGNMGAAIARGLINSATVDAHQLTLADANERALGVLKGEFPALHVTCHNAQAVKGADVVVLAVKPWLVNLVSAEIVGHLSAQSIIVSIAAGVTLTELRMAFSAATMQLIRVIPNTAIAIQQSMTFVAGCDDADAESVATVVRLFKPLGEVMLIDEKYFQAATAVGSCGTAFALRYLRASMEGAIELGLPAADAKKIILQTVVGAMEIVRANDSHPEAEIDKVTTPGGITIRGLNKMEQEGFTNAVIEGLKASV